MNVIAFKNIRIRHNVTPSALTSGVRSANPYLIRYIIRQENMTIRMSITKIVKRDKTLLDKKVCIKIVL